MATSPGGGKPTQKGVALRRDAALSATLEFRNVTYEIKKVSGWPWKRKYVSKTILEDVSGSVAPTDLVALMGASGAGKSTLLNVLSRRICRHDGEVTINGIPADKSPVLKSSACFIQQEDLFYGHITVAEHLKQQARLRIPLPEAERNQRVQDVTDRFSLNKSRNSRIGNISQGASRGISGGEKKRLSVATELLINPSLIFADEPTSGLDSFMAESVVEVLRTLAEAGHTVITTIHQPSSDVFKMFNKLLLLSEGKVVYFGPRLGAIPYFLRLGHPCPPYTNPADFLIELLAIDWENPDSKLQEINKWTESWKVHGREFLDDWETNLKDKFISAEMEDLKSRSTDMTALTSEDANGLKKDSLSSDSYGAVKPFALPLAANGVPPHVPWFAVIATLLQRNFLATKRNPSIARARLIQAIVTGLLGGLVYFRLDDSAWYSKAGACFFVMVNQGFMSTFTAISVFISEKSIVIRERDAGLYHLATYYTSKMLSDLVFQSVLPLLHTAVGWYLMGLNDRFDRFLIAMIFVYLTSLAASSLGYIVAAGAASLGVGLALGPVLLLPLIMVSGFVIDLGSLHAFWIWLRYGSPFVYGYSGLMRATFYNMTYDNVNMSTMAGGLLKSATGNEVLDNFAVSHTPEQWWIDGGVLLAWIILGRFLGMLIFIFVNRKRTK